MKWIDSILNRVTMYKLVLFELMALIALALGLSALGMLSFAPQYLAYSLVVILLVSFCINGFFAYMFDAPSNTESTWITALILALIITPPASWLDMRFLPLAIIASACAVASKYIIAYRKKHIFNPAAFGAAAASLGLGLSASWWVGTTVLAPFVLAGGLLIVRKIHRFDLWFAFMATFSAGILWSWHLDGGSFAYMFTSAFLLAPVFFFGTLMLTEPLTMPGERSSRILYGILTGFFFLPDTHVGSFYFTPELALLAGNLYAFVVSPKYKSVLSLKQIVQLSRDSFEFVFASERKVAFDPGQYMEWTLAHAHPDMRGIRRYFTIASSPGDPDVRLGVKFYDPPSTFKRRLAAMKPGETIVASQIAGDFTLPRDQKKKLAFVAGGIGITPFASMLRQLLDTHEARDIVIFVINRTPEDVLYRVILDQAAALLHAKVVYSFTDSSVTLPEGALGRLDGAAIRRLAPDYRERTFYVSGPQQMVAAYKDTLRSAGVSRRKIKTDYFPGFA